MELKPSLPDAKPENRSTQEKPLKSGHHGVLAVGAVASYLLNPAEKPSDVDILAPKLDIMKKDKTPEVSDSGDSQQGKAA